MTLYAVGAGDARPVGLPQDRERLVADGGGVLPVEPAREGPGVERHERGRSDEALKIEEQREVGGRARAQVDEMGVAARLPEGLGKGERDLLELAEAESLDRAALSRGSPGVNRIRWALSTPSGTVTSTWDPLSVRWRRRPPEVVSTPTRTPEAVWAIEVTLWPRCTWVPAAIALTSR